MKSVEKSVDDIKQLKELEKKVKAIKEKYSGKKSLEKKRNLYLYGGMGLLYLALIVLSLVFGASYISILSSLVLALAMGLIWLQSNMIVDYSYAINVQRDLHKLERDELDKLVNDNLDKMLTINSNKQ